MGVDAVLTFHTSPETCGVAKFNLRLAQQLGVPMLPWRTGKLAAQHPLLSIKPSEVTAVDLYPMPGTFDLFLHGSLDRWATEAALQATRVYAANRVLAREVAAVRPDVIEAFCPSTIRGRGSRGAYQVLTFGMAHKFQRTYYEALKRTLDAEARDYTVNVSTAIHEGSPWDETANVGALLRDVFGDRLRVLGYLADDALARELDACDAVALFFDPAVRANNTTYWAAVAAGKRIFTNRDEWSPSPDARVSWDDLAALLR